MSTVALIGHNGFLGRAIAAALERRGHIVRRVEMPKVQARPQELQRALDQWVTKDDARWAHLVGQLAGADAVVNAAGAASPDSADHELLWSSNTLLPVIVAKAAASSGVRRLVHISSAAVQGDRPVLDESRDVSPQSPYARSKAEAESALLDPTTDVPSSVVIYRPTSVMGRGRRTTERLLSLFGHIIPSRGPHVPLPLALIDNAADAAAFLAVATEVPQVVTHPDEGITVGQLADIAGGRIAPIPKSLANGGVRGLKKAERARPAVAGVRRRAQLLFDGQKIEATALYDLGWVPIRGVDGYRPLLQPAPSANRRVRLAYLITRSDTIAGAQVHVRDLAEAMTKAGHDVCVFVGGGGPFVDQLSDRGVNVVPLIHLKRDLGRADLAGLFEVRRALKEFEPDLLSCHSSKAGILGRAAGRSLGIPTIFTAHGWSFAEGIPDLQRRIYAWIERVMARFTARIINVAHSDRDLAINRKVGRPHQHVTIHNAVHDIDPGQLADPAADSPTIVSIARLDGQKDHPLLLQTLSELPAIYRVLLVGDGPREGQLRRQVHNLGLDSNVEFLGLRHDVADILATAQIYVLVSNWEGLPRSIIEALRAGLPVIATDVGGVRELVENGVNGRLLPRGDGSALRAALTDLLGDHNLRQDMGSASRRRFEEHFTFGRVLAETRAVYSDVLKLEV